MKNIDDETLMAYADSELDEEERKDVELALEGDADARARLEDFIVTGAAISQYAAVLEEPVPDHLEDLVRTHQKTAEVVQFPRMTSSRHWMALAASLVVGVALGSGSMKYFTGSAGHDETQIVYRGATKFPPPNAIIKRRSEIEALLSELPSEAVNLNTPSRGSQINLKSGASLTLVTSFISDTQFENWAKSNCVVAELSETGLGAPVLFVACQKADGTWKVVSK
jgi:hypothetical protein